MCLELWLLKNTNKKPHATLSPYIGCKLTKCTCRLHVQLKAEDGIGPHSDNRKPVKRYDTLYCRIQIVGQAVSAEGDWIH